MASMSEGKKCFNSVVSFEGIGIQIVEKEGIQFNIRNGILTINCINYTGNFILSKDISREILNLNDKDNENSESSQEISIQESEKESDTKCTTPQQDKELNQCLSLDTKRRKLSPRINEKSIEHKDHLNCTKNELSDGMTSNSNPKSHYELISTNTDSKFSTITNYAHNANSSLPLKCALNSTMKPPSERWGHTWTLINCNKIILYGGEDNDEVTCGDMHVYDIKSETWSQPLNSDSVPRSWHSTVFLKERQLIIVFGGELNISGNPEVLSNLMVLDTEVFLWYPPSCSGKPPAARSGHSCSVIDHRLVIFGGSKGRKWYNNTAVLDTKEWKWERVKIAGVPPKPRSYHSATAVDDKIVIFGGNNDAESFNSVHVLQNVQNVWTWFSPEVLGESPSCRTGHSATLLDSKMILIIGGWDPQIENGKNIFKDMFLLNTENWEWTKVQLDINAELEKVGHSCILGNNDINDAKQKLFVFGGQLENGKRSSRLDLIEKDLILSSH